MDITKISEKYYKMFFDIASQERKERAKKFYFQDDAKRCILAEMLLRYSLWLYDSRKTEFEIIKNKYGKPFLKNEDKFFFNISHSDNWVVVAYANTNIGVDIEKNQEDNIKDLARSFMSEDELNVFNNRNKDKKSEKLTRIWTLKESYVKYLGVGISEGLKFFTVDSEEGKVIDNKNKIRENIHLKSCLFDKNYYLSVCSSDKDIKIKKIDTVQLLKFIKELSSTKRKGGQCIIS